MHPLLSSHLSVLCISFFFFNDTATTEIYTLSLHDALPISKRPIDFRPLQLRRSCGRWNWQPHRSLPEEFRQSPSPGPSRSEEHTSELQSHLNLVCRLLLEKKKDK